MEPSPYLPSSRAFFNPLYLRVEQVPEYADLEPAARARVDDLAEQARADTGDLIDRDAVWTAKREALRLVHDVPRSAGREQELRTPSAPGTRRRCATSPRGACSPSTTAATLARGPTD